MFSDSLKRTKCSSIETPTYILVMGASIGGLLGLYSYRKIRKKLNF